MATALVKRIWVRNGGVAAAKVVADKVVTACDLEAGAESASERRVRIIRPGINANIEISTRPRGFKMCRRLHSDLDTCTKAAFRVKLVNSLKNNIRPNGM